MRLQRLTGLEQDKIVAEYSDIMAVIEDLLDILAKPERVSVIIGDELTRSRQDLASTRWARAARTIEYSAQDLSTEDLITPTDMVVTLSHTGYIKSQPLSEYRAQKRGGRGKQATRDQGRRLDRPALHRQHARLHPVLLQPWPPVLAQGLGSALRARVARVAAPSSTCSRCKTARRSTWCCRSPATCRSFPADHYVFMATSMGTVKKTALTEFSNPRKAGIIAVGLDEGDYLIGAALDRRQARRDAVQLTAARPCALTKTMCAPWAAMRAVCAA